MSSGDLISFVLYTDARFVIDLLTYCVKTLFLFFFNVGRIFSPFCPMVIMEEEPHRF